MQAGSCSSDLTHSLVTSICCGCGPKKTKKKKSSLAFLLFKKENKNKTGERLEKSLKNKYFLSENESLGESDL